MDLPRARGPLSRDVLDVLHRVPGDVERLRDTANARLGRGRDVLVDEDVQLSLYLMYELHYGGLPGVDDGWEWSPELLAVRAMVERRHLDALRSRHWPEAQQPCTPEDLPTTLFRMVREGAGAPSGGIAGFVARHATREQVAEALVLRSPYQLKEADPHTFAIPRLAGRAKAALVEIQADEYGNGRHERMHSALFARCMRALGLCDEANHYLDLVPARSLAVVNSLSLFALHRRWRGALCGHLAAFEMTSSLPAQRWLSGLERLGLGVDATEFFDEHVEADAVHEQVAAHDLCGNLAAEHPELVPDVLFGAAVCLGLDSAVADAAVDAWRSDRTALRLPLGARLEARPATRQETGCRRPAQQAERVWLPAAPSTARTVNGAP